MSATDVAVRKRRPRLTNWFLFAILGTSVGGNVFLAYRLDKQGAIRVEGPQRLRAGTTVTAIEGVGPSGERLAIPLSTGDRRTVVFVYSPTCEWCRRTYPLFQQIVSRRNGLFRFLGLCRGDPSDMPPATFPVLTHPSKRTIRLLKLGAVPQTIVFGLDGTVERVWSGAYVDSTKADVEAYFAIRLR